MNQHVARRGFTLVELSIVLVIIGLLVGGVLTGQSLIRAAELRSVTSQFQRYQAAVMTFRDKYFALPGDMTNASAYWGAADGTTGSTTGCKTIASTTAVTCNGDGDGKLSNASAASNELFRFWQHLANAGLIEGSYNGIAAGSNLYATTTANAPVGRISSSYWFVNYIGAQSGAGGWFDGNYDNILMIGGFQTNNNPWTPIFKPEEAYNIDTKLDDGKPATGKIVPYMQVGISADPCTDATTSTQLNANYLLSNSTLQCTLVFRQVF